MPDTSVLRPSKKQKELLSFLDTFIVGHGYGPSYREVMRALDYKSVSTVAVHVNNLIAKGHVRKNGRSARSLEVVTQLAKTSSAEHVTKADVKWLVSKIEAKFVDYESEPTEKKRDDLYVLVGALHVLELKAPASSFKSRLPS